MTWKTARLEPESQLRSTFILRLLSLMHFHQAWKLKNFVISSQNSLLPPCRPKKPNPKVRTLDSGGKRKESYTCASPCPTQVKQNVMTHFSLTEVLPKDCSQRKCNVSELPKKPAIAAYPI